MADERSKREKLVAMANQTASPAEAAVARRKIAAMDAETPPSAESSLDARMARLRNVASGWSPGLRVRVVVIAPEDDDLFGPPSSYWDGD